MGIAYPREIETRELPPPRLMHAPFDVVGNVERLVFAEDGGLCVAGRHLVIDPHEDRDTVVRVYRATLLARLRDRRPDADRHTWSHLTRVVHGMVEEGGLAGEELRRALLEAVDGL